MITPDTMQQPDTTSDPVRMSLDDFRCRSDIEDEKEDDSMEIAIQNGEFDDFLSPDDHSNYGDVCFEDILAKNDQTDRVRAPTYNLDDLQIPDCVQDNLEQHLWAILAETP